MPAEVQCVLDVDNQFTRVSFLYCASHILEYAHNTLSEADACIVMYDSSSNDALDCARETLERIHALNDGAGAAVCLVSVTAGSEPPDTGAVTREAALSLVKQYNDVLSMVRIGHDEPAEHVDDDDATSSLSSVRSDAVRIALWRKGGKLSDDINAQLLRHHCLLIDAEAMENAPTYSMSIDTSSTRIRCLCMMTFLASFTQS